MTTTLKDTKALKKHLLEEIAQLRDADEARMKKQFEIVFRLAKQAPHALVELFFEEEEEEERPIITFLLGSFLSKPGTMEALEAGLQDRNAQVRYQTIVALSQSPKPHALVPYFNLALKDRTKAVKQAAVLWLMKHGDGTSLQPLEHLLEHKGLQKHAPDVIQNAEKTIARIREEA